MKKLLLKSMLLLSALIVGSESLWATPTSATLNMTQSQTSPVVVNGVTFSWTSSYIVTGASSATSNGFCGKSGTADMIVTIPSGKKLVGISKTNGNGWGQTNINVYTGTSSSGTLVAEISQGTNSYTITSNNTGTTYYFVNSASKNAWLQSLTIEYDDNSAVSTPSISGAENFLTSTEVSISCGTDGAAIQYSLDNGTSWTDYSASFILTETTTVKAKASKSGMTTSDVASKTFTKITPLTVTEALTAIDALADNGTIENQYVTGVVSQIDSYNSTYKSITYWISVDGTTTSQLEVYSGKGLNGAGFSSISDLALGDIVVVSGTLKKYVDGTTITPEFTSNSQLFSLTKKVVTPSFSPAAGAVAANTEVTISTTTEGATIYYTTNGSTPTTSSNVYSAPITIDAAMTIKAFAVKTGHPDSDVATASYTIALPCATPTFSIAAGEVAKGTKVTISTETDGATIYYTTNGSTPTTSSTVYSSAITINTAMTLKAIAAKDGMANSEVASIAYSVKDYAVLPFEWAGGVLDDLEDLDGVTTNNIGGDYAVANAPYRVKFDGTGDYILIKTNTQPGKVIIGVKKIGGSKNSTITVQGSSDGTNFTNIQAFSIEGNQNAIVSLKTTNSFAASDRYVRIYFTQVPNGNVGVGPISIAVPEPTAPVVSGSTVTLTTTEKMAGWRTYNNNTDNKYTVDGTTTVYYASETGDSKVTLTEIAGGVPANTAVILHQTNGSNTITLTETENTINAPVSNLLSVSTENQNLGTVYRLGYKTSHGVGFYTYTSTSAPAGIIYISPASTARDYLEFSFDETTAINVVNAVEKVDGQYFDLQGRKVAQPTKGLYIVNGRKVVIK